jgi:hypothetical protein
LRIQIRSRMFYLGLPDPYVFAGSGSISTRYGSGSGFGSGSFYRYYQATIVRKTLIPTVL